MITLVLCSCQSFLLFFTIEFEKIYIIWGKKPLFSGENHLSGFRIDSSKLGADPGMPVEISSGAGETTKVENNRRPTYRCRKCRRLVALQEHVIDHAPGEGETAFGWNKRRGGNPFNKSNESDCSSIFIEPLRWMKAGKKTVNYNTTVSIFPRRCEFMPHFLFRMFL